MMRNAKTDHGQPRFTPHEMLHPRQIMGLFAGIKKGKVEKREKAGKAEKNMIPPITPEDDERGLDEIDALFDTEGDTNLIYEEEPLFDDETRYRNKVIRQSSALFLEEEEEYTKDKEAESPEEKRGKEKSKGNPQPTPRRSSRLNPPSDDLF